MKRKRIMILLGVILSIFAVFAVQSPVAIQGEAMNQYALDGTDPLTYFEGKPRTGSENYKLDADGQTWIFVSESNLKEFEKNPALYQPQFDGKCAFAVSLGKDDAEGRPKDWKVVDGKLYLSSNPVARFLFGLLPNRAEKAQAQWSQMASQ